FASFFCFASIISHLNAQSINNRNWKCFFSDPFNDTLTLHIHSDSTFVTTSNGEVLLKTNCMISGDTLTLLDYPTSEHACPASKGIYKINLNGNSFTLKLIDDPCEGRGQSLDGKQWIEVPK
ncbi:MAG TPA: hypothetical protein VGG71_12020, partial [Chitinophagaceae bacterium]